MEQEILCILSVLKVHYRVNKSLQVDPIFNQYYISLFLVLILPARPECNAHNLTAICVLKT
jgi:hypothetical protein